jgi:hypothetical protein
MMSTLGWWRRIAPTVQTTEKPRPNTVPVIHKTLAGVSAPSSHATPPASSNTVEQAKSSISLLSRNRVTMSFSWLRHAHRALARPQDLTCRFRATGGDAG